MYSQNNNSLLNTIKYRENINPNEDEKYHFLSFVNIFNNEDVLFIVNNDTIINKKLKSDRVTSHTGEHHKISDTMKCVDFHCVMFIDKKKVLDFIFDKRYKYLYIRYVKDDKYCMRLEYRDKMLMLE